MKNFEQFLTEIEDWSQHPDIAGNPQMQAKARARRANRRRSGGPTPEEVKAQIDAKEAARKAAKEARKPGKLVNRPSSAWDYYRGNALAKRPTDKLATVSSPKSGALARVSKPNAPSRLSGKDYTPLPKPSVVGKALPAAKPTRPADEKQAPGLYMPRVKQPEPNKNKFLDKFKKKIKKEIIPRAKKALNTDRYDNDPIASKNLEGPAKFGPATR